MQYRKGQEHCQPGPTPEPKAVERTSRPVLTGLLDGMLDVLLPRCCLLCGAAAGPSGRLPVALCVGCLDDLPRNANACSLCALPTSSLARGLCGGCLRARQPWDRVFVPLRYSWPVDRLIRQLKFQRQPAAGVALAQAMLAADPRPLAQGGDGSGTVPLLIPVPLHWSRTLTRGYNQAQELALHLSRARGWPLEPNHLRRRRRTHAQTRLDAADRRRNLRGAFGWRGPSLHGRRVVLVDDVMTTGSTLAACSKVLRAAGAGPVEAWIAARATLPGGADP